MADNAIRGPGVCQGMATANSMHVAVEALGMALPGAAPVRANSPKMIDLARRSGQRIVDMVLEDLKPRDVMTPGAFRNAAAAVLAVSGSINCIKHLQADGHRVRARPRRLRALQRDRRRRPRPQRGAPQRRGLDRAVRGCRRRARAAQAARAGARHERDDRHRRHGRRQPRDRRRARRRGHPAARPAVLRQAARSSSCTARWRPRARSCKLGVREPGRQSRVTGPAIVFDDGAAAMTPSRTGRSSPGTCSSRAAWASRAAPAWPVPRR